MRPALVLVLSGCSVVVSYDATDAGTLSASDTDTDADTDADSDTDADPDPDTHAIVGEGEADGIGAGGLLLAPDLDGDGSAELLVGAPALQAVGVFDGDEIGEETPFGAARLQIVGDGVGRSMAIVADDGGPLVAVGSAAVAEVWLVSAGAMGVVDASEVAVGRITSGSSGDGDEGALGASLAVGDWDGDGRVDLAVGAPDEQGGAGRARVLRGAEGYTTGTFDADDASVRVRGVGGRFGTSVSLGALDSSGRDRLLACAPLLGAGGTCDGIAGPGDVDDRDVDEVSVAHVSGAAGDALGTASPRIVDVDLDGVADLLLPAASGILYVFLSGLDDGAHDVSEADLVVGGGVAAATGDGALLIGAPEDNGTGAMFEVASVPGTWSLPLDGTRVWSGTIDGARFGAVSSDPGALIGPFDIAVGSPSAAGRADIFSRRSN